MTAQPDNQSNASSRHSPRWRRRVLLITLLLAPIVLVVALSIIGVVLTMNMGVERGEAIKPENISREVALDLMHWGILAPTPQTEPQYDNLLNSIACRIRGIQGYHTSDGFHGDGIDCYEFELSTDLANELRLALARPGPPKPPLYIPHPSKAPAWWPYNWPVDVQCYEKNNRYLFFPTTGTHAWFLRLRT